MSDGLRPHPEGARRPRPRCSVMQVADRDWWCVTHGRDADVCERETGQSDDTDPALPPFEPGGVA